MNWGLYDVASFDTSKKILNVAKLDQTLCVALADISDLIATEGKYHLRCCVAFRKGSICIREK